MYQLLNQNSDSLIASDEFKIFLEKSETDIKVISHINTTSSKFMKCMVERMDFETDAAYDLDTIVDVCYDLFLGEHPIEEELKDNLLGIYMNHRKIFMSAILSTLGFYIISYIEDVLEVDITGVYLEQKIITTILFFLDSMKQTLVH